MPAWWGGRDLRAMLPKDLLRALPRHVAARGTRGQARRLPGRLLLPGPRRRGLRALRRRGARVAPRGARPRPLPPFFALAQRRRPRRGPRRHRAGQRRARSPSTPRSDSRLLPGDDEVDGVAVTTDHGPHGDAPACASSSSSRRRRANERRGIAAPAAGRPADRIPTRGARAARGRRPAGRGARADAVRRRLHPGDEVTFIVDRNINYTDYCLSGCRFCAFYKKPGSGEGYLLRRGRHPPQDRGDAGARRHRHHDAGRPAPGPRHLLVYEEVFSGIKARLPHPHPLALAAGDRAHRQAERAERGGDADAAPRRRPRQPARWRRRGAGRPRAHRHQPAQDPDGHVAGRDARRPRPRHEDHGDDDVRLAATRPPSGSSTCAAYATCRTRPGGFTAFIPWTFQAGNTELQAGHGRPPGIDYLRCSRSRASTSTTCPTCRRRGSRRDCAWGRSRWPSAQTTWAPP